VRDDQHRFLMLLGQLPARLTAEQAAWVLNCQAHDMPVLVAARVLKPLGSPQPNSATGEVLELSKDRTWLTKLTNTVGQHWKEKNLRKKGVAPFEAKNGEATALGYRVTC
jgi:hypothetical protein